MYSCFYLSQFYIRYSWHSTPDWPPSLNYIYDTVDIPRLTDFHLSILYMIQLTFHTLLTSISPFYIWYSWHSTPYWPLSLHSIYDTVDIPYLTDLHLSILYMIQLTFHTWLTSISPFYIWYIWHSTPDWPPSLHSIYDTVNIPHLTDFHLSILYMI